MAAPIKLVIVEDDPMVMEVNAEFVSRIEGFAVVGRAGTGAAACQVIRDTQPELVLLDYFLPDMDGLAILQAIRKQDLPLDVILVTANRDPEHIKQILRYGAIDYILKPFRFERIRTAFEQYRLTRSKLAEDQPLEQHDLDEITGVRPARFGSSADDDAATHQPVPINVDEHVHSHIAQSGYTAGDHASIQRRELYQDTKFELQKGIESPKHVELPKANDLPKGLNERTLRQIMNFVELQSESMSAEEIAVGTGLARVTARRYLEYLEKSGHIKLEVQYGSVGRPVNRYKH